MQLKEPVVKYFIPNGTASRNNLSCQIIISLPLIVTLAVSTLSKRQSNCFSNTIRQMCKIQILTGLRSCWLRLFILWIALLFNCSFETTVLIEQLKLSRGFSWALVEHVLLQYLVWIAGCNDPHTLGVALILDREVRGRKCPWWSL